MKREGNFQLEMMKREGIDSLLSQYAKLCILL